jgi:hypothetical protein
MEAMEAMEGLEALHKYVRRCALLGITIFRTIIQIVIFSCGFGQILYLVQNECFDLFVCSKAIHTKRPCPTREEAKSGDCRSSYHGMLEDYFL